MQAIKELLEVSQSRRRPGEIPSEALSDPNVHMPDRQIHNNTQLGWGRVAYARVQLETTVKAVRGGYSKPFAWETSLGVLDRHSDISGSAEDRDRRVETEIFASRSEASQKAMAMH
jgi:hypothetical protein